MEATPRILLHQTSIGREPGNDWLKGLRDEKGRAAIRVRLNRLQAGNFSNCEPVGNGVHELKIDFQPDTASILVMTETRWFFSLEETKIRKVATSRKLRNIGRTTMPKRTTDYRSTLLEALKDPVEAQNYLTAALNDSEDMFLLALRDVAEAHQMSKVAGKVGVSRESLYRMLTASGNPTYRNFFGILRALDVAFGDIRGRGSARSQSAPKSTGHGSKRRHNRVESAHSSAEASNPSLGNQTTQDINAKPQASAFRFYQASGVKKQDTHNPSLTVALRAQQQLVESAA